MFNWGEIEKSTPKPKFPKRTLCGKKLKKGGWCGKNKNHWFGCTI